MDWKALKNKALDISAKAMEASAKALEKGKEMAENAKNKQEALKEKATEITEKALETKDSITEKIESTKEKIQDKKEELDQKTNEIKENIDEKKEEINSNSKSFFDKAKSFGSKTMNATTGVLAKSSPTIKILADYEKVKDDKILVMLFLKKNDEESKKMQVSMPLTIKNAWVNGVTFRSIDIEDSYEVADKFEVELSPFLIVFEKGEEKLKTSDIEIIKKYLKDFII